MLKALFEGKINPYLSSDSTMVQGTLVKLDPANVGKFVAANAGDAIYGIVAQDVIAANVDNYKLDSVTHKARVGDKVGIYYGGGLYLTDNFSGNVTAPNTPLYAGPASKFTTVASGNGSIIAYAETLGNSANADKIRVKLITQ